jgi:predicted nucleic acid-binding protein
LANKLVYGADGLKDFLLNEYVSLEKIDNVMLKRSFELMDKYADLPMDFADATLVVLAEKHRTNKVFTLDFCDFQTYRFLKGHRYYSFVMLGSNLLK